jgi:hypothetical protein
MPHDTRRVDLLCRMQGPTRQDVIVRENARPGKQIILHASRVLRSPHLKPGNVLCGSRMRCSLAGWARD